MNNVKNKPSRRQSIFGYFYNFIPISCGASILPHRYHLTRLYGLLPNVSGRACVGPGYQSHGRRGRCEPPYLYDSICEWQCNEGYELPDGGATMTTRCVVETIGGGVRWDEEPPACIGTRTAENVIIIIIIFIINYNSLSNYYCE